MVPEAALEQTETGLAPVGEGCSFPTRVRRAGGTGRGGGTACRSPVGRTSRPRLTSPQLGVQLVVLGAGDGPCVALAVGAREHIGEHCNGGAYPVDEAALRRAAGVEKETSDPGRAYARFPEPEPTRYRDGSLPGGE
jgi:hypothetical protein